MPRGGHNKNSRNTLCKRGHLLSGDNLYVSPKGSRQCKTGMRLTHDEYRKTEKGRLAKDNPSLLELAAMYLRMYENQ